ncbi:MAG: N-acetylmuramoyl-L-alanine amidase [Chthoniobacterales bacterium]|nr:N-acetylmuramoyl-L-alanine amidase [Chthoniobacterales bacterium]
MRRVLAWLGLVCLTISFVWFVSLPVPMNPATAPRPPLGRGQSLPVVVLDAGHGGQDSGAMCGAVLEKDLTLDVAQRAELLLRAAGYSTVLTRDSDRYLSLAERAAVGNQQDDSLFISIHFNDGERAAASGVETYYALHKSSGGSRFFSWLPFLQHADNGVLASKSESLASCIQAELVGRTRAVDRGTKSEQFYVIANVRHPAALVEGGFINNKTDVMKLATTEYRQQIALAINDGVRRYRETNHASEPSLALATAHTE